MVFTIIPRALPRPSFQHKPKTLIQPNSTLVERERANAHAMHIGMLESPLDCPEDSFASIAFVLVGMCDTDGNGCVAMMRPRGIWSQESDGAYWDGLGDSLNAICSGYVGLRRSRDADDATEQCSLKKLAVICCASFTLRDRQ